MIPALLCSAKDYFDAISAVGIRRARLVEYQGMGVAIVFVPRAAAATIKAIATPDRIPLGVVLLFDKLPWWSCWFRRYQLETRI